MMNRKITIFHLGFLALLLSLPSLSGDTGNGNETEAAAADKLPVAPSALLPVEDMLASRADAEALAARDGSDQRVVEQWDRAITARREAQRVKEEFESLRGYVATANPRAETLTAELERLGKAQARLPDNSQSYETQAIRNAINGINNRISEAEHSLNNATEALGSPLYNPAQARERMNESRRLRELLDTELKGSSDTAIASSGPRHQLQLAQRQLHSREMDYFDLIVRENETLRRMQILQRDVATATIAHERALRALWNIVLEERLAGDARAAMALAEQHKRETATAPDAIRDIANYNFAINEELQDIFKRDAEATIRLEQAESALQKIQSDADSMKQRFEIVGPTENIGILLLRRRAELPARRNYRLDFFTRQSLISETANRQLDIDAERGRLANMPQEIQAIMDLIPADNPDHDKLRKQIPSLLAARRQTLTELSPAISTYIAKLSAIQLTENKLIEQSQKFRARLEEWLMTTPTASTIAPKTFFTAFPLATKSIFNEIRANHARLAQELIRLPRDTPLPTLLAIAAMLLALAARRPMRKRLLAIAHRIGRIKFDSFTLTLETFSYTVVHALPLPILAWILALTLRANITETSLIIQACAQGLQNAAWMMLLTSLMRQTLKPTGLAELHFNWSPEPIRFFARELRIYSHAATILVFIVAFNAANTGSIDSEGDGRVAFILLMILTSFFAYRLLGSRSPFRKELEQRSIGSKNHWRLILIPLAAVFPCILAIVSAFGYEFAAVELAKRLFFTTFFIFVLFISRDMLFRWLYLVERRLRYRDALRRLEEARAERSRPDDSTDDREELTVEVPEINFDQLSDKARRLIRAAMLFGAIIGFWYIWIDSLSLFNFLNEATLPLSIARYVGGAETPLSLGDFTAFALAVFLTVVAVANLPGLIELLLLQASNLETGVRYAIVKLSQYIIIALGIITGGDALGFRWNNIQWLVAALSVGIGFGLQEIVANFICGILILFERPIRIGDIVTVGDTTGMVSRVQMRATTILNWERQELIIPNKEFITGRVLNWTLSDTTNRVILNVGIAYGSDIQLALSLLSEAAEENNNVLREPRWAINFESFGESSLNLTLRAYIPSPEDRMATITRLNTAIHEKFKKHSISIPFPQRDVHIISPQSESKDTRKPSKSRKTASHRP